MNSVLLTDFIIEKIKKFVKKNFSDGKKTWVSDLTRYTRDIIRQHGNYQISFPICISLDNCVGFYTPSQLEDDLVIKEDSVIKVELGLFNKITENYITIGETIFLKSTKETELIEKCFKEIKEKVKKIKAESNEDLTTDDIRLFLEGHLAEYNLVPIQNCISFQQSFDTIDQNYFYLNYKKEYDSQDYLIPLPNLNFDISKGDTYDINITVCLENESDGPLKFIIESGNVFKVNDPILSKNLKMKSARQLASIVKSKVAFDFEDLQSDFNKVGLTKLSSKLGLKECLSSKFLEEYQVYYTKDKRRVFHLKFSVTF